jgi:hypothetical protein
VDLLAHPHEGLHESGSDLAAKEAARLSSVPIVSTSADSSIGPRER